MIYRIHFEAKGAYWCIQMLKYGVFWTTVMRPTSGLRGQVLDLEPITFDTFKETEDYVDSIGLSEAYDRRPTKGFLSSLSSGHAHYEVPDGYRLVPLRQVK